MKTTNTKYELTADIVTITPELADKWLTQNYPRNRKLRPTRVAYYAKQIRSGQWKLNGQAIIFDENNTIIDGQHRLYAVCESDTEIRSLVVWGVARDAFMTIDDTLPKGHQDTLCHEGVANSSSIAAIVNSVLMHRRAVAASGSFNSAVRPSKTDIMEEYNKHSDVYQEAYRAGSKCRRDMKLTVKIAGAVFALACIDGGHNIADVDVFWDSVATGAGLNIGSPALTLRNRVIQNSASKTKMTHSDLHCIAVKAWNHHVSGKECRLLKFSSDEKCPRVW